MAKTPTYEADSVQELIGRLKSGEIPGSYVVQGLGDVGKGGKVRAVSKTALGKPGKAAFEQEQRRQSQNKKEAKALSETARQSAIEKITKQATEKKEATKQREAGITTAEEARKKQAKQWEAYAQGVKTSWAKGTLPKGFEKAEPSEVGTTNLKEGAKPTEVVPVVPEQKQKPVSYPESVSDAVQAAANAEYQRTGQRPNLTTEKVAKLQEQIDIQARKVAAAEAQGGGGGPFNPFAPGDWVDVGAQAVTGGLELAAKPLDILSRTGYAVSSGWESYSNPDKSMSDVMSDMWEGLKGERKTDWMDVINANRSGVIKDPNDPTKLIEFDQKTQQWVPAKELNPWVTAPTALVGGALMDPLTYVGVGTIPAIAKGVKAGGAATALIDINNSAIKQAAKVAAQKGATAAAERAGKNVAKKMTKAGGIIGGQTTAHEELANNLFQKAIASGVSLPDAIAGVRVAIEREVIGDAAKQKLATLAERGIRDNRRILNLKVAGKNIPIGKVPLLDVPYRGARALKGKALETDVGQGLARMFSTKYWFPGETATLFNKANSLGVAGYTQRHEEIRAAFKGYSRKDVRRIADETEMGVDLSGEFGTKGKDLGPAQKFYKQLSDGYYDERVKILGKEGDKVEDFVHHHYRKGSPKKIRDIKKIRKQRFEDGAVGAERLTLQEAEDLGLRPIREADKILLAHTADHQRQMVKSMFDQKLIGTYGHVLDDPILAEKLGLVAAKPPKAMKMRAGHKLYMHPDVKKVYTGVREFMGANDEETKALWRFFDKGMRGWKMGATTLRPGHHIRNAIGDMYLNYLDGVQNPYRYQQALKMIGGDRSKLRIRVGNQLLDGDDIERLMIGSGANRGFISSEYLEGRNPVLSAIQGFSQKREMVGRYAHFIDTLVKEGNLANLGANNKAGLYKIATEGGRRINKFNINYGDLTPFERNTMKRIMPFYTWTRKSMPLMIESLATRPGRMLAAPRMNTFLSQLTGNDPDDLGPVPYPEWLKDVGFSRISDGEEPNVWSLPLPSQDFGNWFGGGTPPSVIKEFLGNVNPLAQVAMELGTGRNLFTGGQLTSDEHMYAAGKFGVLKNILDIVGVGDKPLANRINAGLGIGTRQVTENEQIGELRRQQDPLDVKISQINKDLGDFEVHKLKHGYSVYNKHWKLTEKSGFSSPEDALIYAIGLSNKAKGK